MGDFNIHQFDAKPFLDPREIEYKKVDIQDFIDCKYVVNEINIIPDLKGFVTVDLFNKIEIKNSSTDVINIPTGSGKTTAIYRKIKEIIDQDEKSIIILATPFIALVGKDFDYLTKGFDLDPDIITKYTDLQDDLNMVGGEISLMEPITKAYINNKRIHITTINALLRNPGDVAFEQKMIKTNYFLQLLEHCDGYKKHVYLFLDEIHASIHNFRNEYIHNLTIWKKVIHKCIVSTATYTEPVNIVVKHLAYLTCDNINVMECDRTKKPEISPLDIVFVPETYSSKNSQLLDYFLFDWIKSNLKDGSFFHILSYSKKFAKEVFNKLKNEYINTQLLTSATKNKFNPNMNNIGTNFSTGVDIKNPNDLLIIIYPSKYSDEMVKGEEGIFYDGLPTILQAVARLRSKGRVLFVISPMKAIIDDEKTRELISMIPFYNNSDATSNKNTYEFVKETFLKNENAALKNYIKRRKERHIIEYNRYKNDVTGDGIKRPIIQYFNEETFILDRGQEYLKYSSYKSGKYITPYVLWGAIHDQFINCSMDIVYFVIGKKINLYLTSENIGEEILKHISKDNISNINTEFDEYYKGALFLLYSTKRESNNYEVKIILDGKRLLKKQISTNTTLFSGILGSYLNIKGCPYKNVNIQSYISLMVSSYEKYPINTISKDDYKITYAVLDKIILSFVDLYKDQVFTLGEINLLPFFTDDLVEEIYKIHEILKEKDKVIRILARIGSFWKIKDIDGDRFKSSVISKFIESYINRGQSEDKLHRRKILGYKLNLEEAKHTQTIYDNQVQVAPKKGLN